MAKALEILTTHFCGFLSVMFLDLSGWWKVLFMLFE